MLFTTYVVFVLQADPWFCSSVYTSLYLNFYVANSLRGQDCSTLEADMKALRI